MTPWRGITPGPVEYESKLLDKYCILINDRVGASRAHLPEIKGIKATPPGKYSGKNDLAEFETWLHDLLRFMRIHRVCGPELDEERVILTGSYLSEIAATWYFDNVESPSREIQNWTFVEVIIGIYKRFMTEMSAQKANDAYEKVKFVKSKGALAFWNELDRLASRMIQCPDPYSMKKKFLKGLPHEIVKEVFCTYKISAEHSTIEEIIEATRQMENAFEYIEHHSKVDSHQPKVTSTNQNNTTRNSEKQSTDTAKMANNYNSRPYRVVKRYRNDGRVVSSNRQSFRKPFNNNGNKPNMSTGQGLPPRKDDKSQAKCFSCGQIGHYSNDPKCPKNGNKPNNTRPNQPRVFAAQVIDDQSEEEKGEPSAHLDHNSEKGDGDRDNNEDAIQPNDSEIDRANEDHQSNYDGEQYDSDYEYELQPYESDDWPDDDRNVVYLRTMSSNPRYGNLEIKPAPDIYANPERPFRSAVHKSLIPVNEKGSREPPDNPEAMRCLAAYIDINGVKAYVLFDSGSTTDCISPEFTFVAGLQVYSLIDPVPLQLGCVGSRSSINFGTQVEVSSSKTSAKFHHYFDVVNIDRYDAILGTPFMHKFGVCLDFCDHLIVFKRQGRTLPSFSFEEEEEILKKRKSQKSSRVKSHK